MREYIKPIKYPQPGNTQHTRLTYQLPSPPTTPSSDFLPRRSHCTHTYENEIMYIVCKRACKLLVILDYVASLDYNTSFLGLCVFEFVHAYVAKRAYVSRSYSVRAHHHRFECAVQVYNTLRTRPNQPTESNNRCYNADGIFGGGGGWWQPFPNPAL